MFQISRRPIFPRAAAEVTLESTQAAGVTLVSLLDAGVTLESSAGGVRPCRGTAGRSLWSDRVVLYDDSLAEIDIVTLLHVEWRATWSAVQHCFVGRPDVQHCFDGRIRAPPRGGLDE